jgi:hypothetical protein
MLHVPVMSLYETYFLFLQYWDLNSGPTPWATAGPPSPFLVTFIYLFICFWDRVFQITFLGWLWTAILLISASWVAGITGVSRQPPGWSLFLHSFSAPLSSRGLVQVCYTLTSSMWPQFFPFFFNLEDFLFILQDYFSCILPPWPKYLCCWYLILMDYVQKMHL